MRSVNAGQGCSHAELLIVGNRNQRHPKVSYPVLVGLYPISLRTHTNIVRVEHYQYCLQNKHKFGKQINSSRADVYKCQIAPTFLRTVNIMAQKLHLVTYLPLFISVGRNQ